MPSGRRIISRSPTVPGARRRITVRLRGSLTYRSLFPPPAFDYTGLDIEDGHNVDLVAPNPFSWDLPSESFDVVISGQMFEHNAYPWITMAEIARITAQGGLIAIIAPSNGQSHRVPFDCWRFYPDSSASPVHLRRARARGDAP